MTNIQFFYDHRNHKAPKKIDRKPNIINLPKYVIKQLEQHRNTFIHKKYAIEDVIYTLKQHGINCVHEFDGDNGYILRMVII